MRRRQSLDRNSEGAPRPRDERTAPAVPRRLKRMQVATNGIALEVEDHGSPNGEPLLLVMGLGLQLVAWEAGFVAGLVAQGFRVIRFDNRDIGLSQRLDHLRVPNLALGSMRYAMGLPVRAPYTLGDMADDTAGLLDALGIRAAHVCAISMGGMIAQHLAVRHPSRVKSLTLMMTTSGARNLPQPSLKLRAYMVTKPADGGDEQRVIDYYVGLFRRIGSPGYPAPDADLQERMTESVRRSYRPQGSLRQLFAIAADGDRSSLLGGVRVPTQIVHGTADPLVPLAAGRDLARKIAGARIEEIEGMGHDLPRPLWPRFEAGIRAAAGRA